MDIDKRYSKVSEQNYKKFNLNRNEFTPTDNKTGTDVIMEYLKQKDVAPWFRGTSHLHMLGADKLFNSLRDDGEQKTTHRVRTCLGLIGLKPLITPKQIMFLMRLSRGNDLVFLWFLMELHYKTPKRNSNSYSVNEQLICSAICHLDMVATLRELDKILPTGHTPETEMKAASQKSKKIDKVFKNQNNETTASQFVLPYFSKHRRPVLYGKRLVLKEPNFKVNFYNIYNNPLQNESNRWYADYHFDSDKRIVHLIIREIIKNIFYNYEAISLRLGKRDVLCGYHRTIKMMAADLALEFKVKVRNECLNYYLKSKDNSKKIKCYLENEVQQQMCNLKVQSMGLHNNDIVKVVTSDCKIVDVILENREHCNSKTELINETVSSSKIIHNKKHNNFGSNGNDLEAILNAKSTKTNSDSISDYCNNNDADMFNRPLMHKPFKFDYRKIFVPECKDDDKRCIRKMCLEALDANVSSLSLEVDQSDLIYDQAVKKYVIKTFDREVNKYEAEKKEEITAHAESLEFINQHSSLTNCNVENFHLMDRMLFEAFQYLRKNPKFVWAQLPDAHRIPLLREWIARRFGKEYSPLERAKSYRMSCIIFRALDKSKSKLTAPNAKQLGKNVFLNYGCKSHLDKKVRNVRSKNYHLLDSSFLEHTRVFWFAMRGYICSNGPPRKSFYAYMPSRQQDIHHFRLWKSTEYRNCKVAWNARRHQKKP